MESQQADAVLAALPWRCFHCDFVTSDPADAQAHFGDRDDASEFKPICKWWSNLSDDERKHSFQDLQRELTAAQDESDSLRVKVEGLEYQVGSMEGAIRSYRPFKDCHSIHDVFCLFDSMEGRALAAEESLKANG